MPGCSSPPVISASRRNRCAAGRVVGVARRGSASAPPRDAARCRAPRRRRPARPGRGAGARGTAGRRWSRCRRLGRRCGRASPSLGREPCAGRRARASPRSPGRPIRPASRGSTARRRSRPGSSPRPRRASRVERDHRLQQRPRWRRVEVAAVGQVVGQAPGLVERPGLEGGHELHLVDEPVLQREQPEQEVAVGGGSHGELRANALSPASPATGTEPGREGSVATRGLSHCAYWRCISAGPPTSSRVLLLACNGHTSEPKRTTDR